MVEYTKWFKDGYNYAVEEITLNEVDVVDMLEAISSNSIDDFDKGIVEALLDYDRILKGEKGLMK